MAIRIFADGGCRYNGKENAIGGYGSLLYLDGQERMFSGAFLQTTNNQMEMMGVLVALQAIPMKLKFQQITVTSDSKYLINGMDKWIHGWVRKGWVTATGAPVMNMDLWKQLKAYDDRHMIHYEWVKGHQGHVENERCDALATMAMNELVYRREQGEEITFFQK